MVKELLTGEATGSPVGVSIRSQEQWDRFVAMLDAEDVALYNRNSEWRFYIHYWWNEDGKSVSGKGARPGIPFADFCALCGEETADENKPLPPLEDIL